MLLFWREFCTKMGLFKATHLQSLRDSVKVCESVILLKAAILRIVVFVTINRFWVIFRVLILLLLRLIAARRGAVTKGTQSKLGKSYTTLINDTLCAHVYDKVRTQAFRALDIDCASMCHDNLFANTETQANSCFVNILSLAKLAKVLEQLLLDLTWDSTSTVSEDHLKMDFLASKVIVCR